MTVSPDLLQELRASRPSAPAPLRTRVREIAAAEPKPVSWRVAVPWRRAALVAIPAAAVLAIAAAGVVGIAHPNGEQAAVPRSVTHLGQLPGSGAGSTGSAPVHGAPDSTVPKAAPQAAAGKETLAPDTTPGPLAPSPNRAQRVTATLTLEVGGSDAVSQVSQEALDLTRSLGGHVVQASVQTGDAARASLAVRIPVGNVQEAVTGFSALGKVTSQQLAIDDLQESLDELTSRAASLRSQIVKITAKLDSKTLDAETRAALEARRARLRSELREVRRGIGQTNAEARFATFQLAVVTPASLGIVPAPSRLDRTLDGALNALVWEGVIALAVTVVAAPLVLVAVAFWLGRRLYRRREEERLLAT
jgi:protein-S-isoprenylcysteine O-methyltransferase Ste14